MKIQISKNEKHDFDAFLELPKGREVCFEQASKESIETKFHTNEIAKNLHPAFFWVRVREIIEETHDTKSFVLEADKEHGTNRLPKFQSGQYMTLEVPTKKGLYKRAYSISSFSKYLKDGVYQITVKKDEDDVVSRILHEEVEVGAVFLARGPFGNFVYNPIRDSKTIVAIAGGSGITPIKAMAEAVREKKLDVSLTILYGAKTERDLIFKETLDRLAKNNSKIKVIYVLSEEEKEGYEHGFITKDLISKYNSPECSYFVCGPIPLYKSLNKIFISMDIPNKYIRHDLYPEFEFPTSNQTFEIRVLSSLENRTIRCSGDETIMAAMEREGIQAPKRCGVGVCGFCRSKLIDGEVLSYYEYVRKADQEYRFIHPCATYPLSDLIIQLPN